MVSRIGLTMPLLLPVDRFGPMLLFTLRSDTRVYRVTYELDVGL